MLPEARRRIAVVTGSRADYGLLRGLVRLLAARGDTVVELIVTGAHLSEKFGETWRAIESDGLVIAAKVDLKLGGDDRASVARATGLGVQGFAEVLSVSPPDLLVVLGDRYEILAAATAALLLGVPIAHIQGGEVTEGAFDDAIRHAVSKMAHLHFVAAQAYGDRLVRMGESPDRVFVVGAPGIDELLAAVPQPRRDVLSSLGLQPSDRYLLVTLHPETMDLSVNVPMADALLAALENFPDHRTVFTGVNADPGNLAIDQRIRQYVDARPSHRKWFVSLGSERYPQALMRADAVVGNSSSGIIEAPAVGTPTVNIGNRQRGRLRARSIVDAEPVEATIEGAISLVLTAEFKSSCEGQEPPYGRGGASARIAEILASVEAGDLGPKGFYDG